MKDLLSFLFLVGLLLPRLDAMHANKRGSAFRKQQVESQIQTQSYEATVSTTANSTSSLTSSFNSQDSKNKDAKSRNFSTNHQPTKPRKLYARKQKEKNDKSIETTQDRLHTDNSSNEYTHQFLTDFSETAAWQKPRNEDHQKCINRTFQFKNPSIKVELLDGSVILNNMMMSPKIIFGSASGTYNGTKMKATLRLQGTMSEQEVIAAVQAAFPGASLE